MAIDLKFRNITKGLKKDEWLPAYQQMLRPKTLSETQFIPPEVGMACSFRADDRPCDTLFIFTLTLKPERRGGRLRSSRIDSNKSPYPAASRSSRSMRDVLSLGIAIQPVVLGRSARILRQTNGYRAETISRPSSLRMPGGNRTERAHAAAFAASSAAVASRSQMLCYPAFRRDSAETIFRSVRLISSCIARRARSAFRAQSSSSTAR